MRGDSVTELLSDSVNHADLIIGYWTSSISKKVLGLVGI